MDDLISRQAASKAIEDLQDCYNGFSDTYDKACIIGVIEEIPTAQVNTPTDAPTDTIDRQAAIDATWEEPMYADPINVLTEVRDRLNVLPTIELVRCRECKHRDLEDKKCDCGHGIVWQLARDDNWFCADVKRRSENDED